MFCCKCLSHDYVDLAICYATLAYVLFTLCATNYKYTGMSDMKGEVLKIIVNKLLSFSF